ncbi:MAG: Co2+/Mg2+ efflux protein ApaG [Cyclobacteriaceae bacterium]|nr:Co2+/Mg2+ efflux protein ApaG [Cyclobacteriaceae bacterium]
MVTKTTNGITVSVITEYQPGYSSPSQYHYVFTYKIKIRNESENTIKLLKRFWKIHDATYNQREISGEGVVGKQPVIEPGEFHEYISGCTLKSGYGKMYGHYTVERLIDGGMLKINIPEFVMVAPFKLN